MEAKPAEVPAEVPPVEAAAPAEQSPVPYDPLNLNGPAETEKPTRPPLTPEEKAQRKIERDAKRKEQRIAARQAAKERKAAGEPPKPKPEKAAKAASGKAGEVELPEGAAPKITVGKIPSAMTSAELQALFEKYGTILRAEISRRKGRPTIGTITFNTPGDVRRAVAALNGKHKCEGESEPLSIQIARDAQTLGEKVKTATDSIVECLKQYSYKPSVLRAKGARELINKMVLVQRTPPAPAVQAAALLVLTNTATAQELVDLKMIPSADPVTSLLKDEPVKAAAVRGGRAAAAAAAAEPAVAKVEKTFDAVVPLLDKLEKERWNRMAKANLRTNERHRFRFVDILATPSLELWRWMVEDCEMSPAEAGTCFAILQKYYGFSQ